MTPNPADAAYLSGLTLLYVEDDPAILASTSDFLRRRVARLCVAGDGIEGLAVFHREKPHLLVTDIMMPRMDGLSLTEAIRAEAPDLPVIVITAFEQTRFLMRAIDLGVDRYVLKPVAADQLEEALHLCARQLRAEEESRQRQRLERELLRAHERESLCILAQGMAHDYNNLLQAILTCVYAAELQTEPGSQAHGLLARTEQFAQVAKQLGRQLLLLGEANCRLNQEGPLEALVAPLVATLPADSGIAVALSFPEDLPPVRFNREGLGQALRALITNAVEAMPQGGTLQLEATRQEVVPDSADLSLRPGSYLRLAVRDSGAGIPEHLLPRVFDPYFSSKDRGSQKGQGLGLAICRSILLAHGGQVTVESQPGQGTTFQMYLPVAP